MIYFLQCETTGLVKIGTSKTAATLERRIWEIRSCSPTTLKLRAAVPGWFSEENRLHHVHRDKHVHGEWFQIDTPDVPPDASGLCAGINARGAPSKTFRKTRTCTRCGAEHHIDRRSRPGKGHQAVRKWCDPCLAARREAEWVTHKAAEHGVPAVLFRKWRKVLGDDGLAIEAARVDGEFMARWRECRAAGISSLTITTRIEKGLTFDEVLAAGPGKAGAPPGTRRGQGRTRSLPPPKAERVGPLAEWLQTANATLDQVADVAGVTRSTIHRALRGYRMGPRVSRALAGVVGCHASEFRVQTAGQGAKSQSHTP